MVKDKRILIALSIFLIVGGFILLIPSLLYFIRIMIAKQLIDNTKVLINIVMVVIGFTSDLFGVILALTNIFKKEPPSLVEIPTTFTGRVDIPIVGRENNLFWLQSIKKDSLLCGQPGSGKTYLLYQFAKDNRGLFVDRDDINAITREYKKKRPKYLVIDDGQFHLDLLNRLLHYRERKKANFILIISCWPGYQDQLAVSMNLTEDRINKIDELTRDEIVKIIKYAGIEGSDDLVREIVNQSFGRPGLAITLAEICLGGGLEDVIFGNVLTRCTTSYLSSIVGDKAKNILAAFAVGGNSGLDISSVAEVLKASLSEVHAIVTKAASGILFQTGQRLAVYPPVLRFTLVRDVFFGSAPLPIELIIDKAPSIKEVGETLIGAKARGANIPWPLLNNVLQKAGSGELWGYFADLGKEETSWVLSNHPEYLIDVAQSALDNDPEITIPLLLNKSIGDNRQLNSNVDHPLRLLEDWVISAYPGKGEAILRRRHVLNAVKVWIKTVDQTDTAYRALKIALSPQFHRMTLDPGSEERVSIHYGSLTFNEVLQLEEIWSHVLDLLAQYSCDDLKPIKDIIYMWVYPKRFEPIKPDVVSEMKSEASKMLKSILPILSEKPGFLQWAHRLSIEADLNISVTHDPIFEILYPVRERKELQESEKLETTAVYQLSTRWLSRSPDICMKELSEIETEARAAGISWPSWSLLLCSEISRQTGKPIEWINSGIKYKLNGYLIEPFFIRALKIDPSNCIEIAKQCLLRPEYKFVIIRLALNNTNIPDAFLEVVYKNLEGADQLVETCCMRNEISESKVDRLLQHSNPMIANAAAMGLWIAKPTKMIPFSLKSHWEEAIIKGVPPYSSYYEEIFRINPHLAIIWLNNIINEEIQGKSRKFYNADFENVLRWAVLALDKENKKELLKNIKPSFIIHELIIPLVGEDDELYRSLLANDTLKEYHLVPLFGNPRPSWVNKAILAAEAGYKLKDIMFATRYREFDGPSWIGKKSDMWSEWIKEFEPFLLNNDDRIREIAKLAIDYATREREHDLISERKRAVFGREQ